MIPIAKPIIARKMASQFNQPNRGINPIRLITNAITPITIDTRFMNFGIDIKVRILREP